MTYLIREMRKEDIPQVLDLVHEFQKESLDSYSLFCNDDKTTKLCEALYQNCLVLESDKVVGVIGGVIGTSINDTTPIMQELIWFVSKSHRKQGCELLKRFEQLSIDRGCKQLLMVHMGTPNRDIMERFYSRQGYRLLECQYLKCLQ